MALVDAGDPHDPADDRHFPQRAEPPRLAVSNAANPFGATGLAPVSRIRQHEIARGVGHCGRRSCGGVTVGFMDKMRSVVGGVSPELMQNGTLARGEVVSVQMTGMSVSRGDQVTTQKQVCNITLSVIMDNTPPFQASVKQGIPVLVLPQLASPRRGGRGAGQSREPSGGRRRSQRRTSDGDARGRWAQQQQCGRAAGHRDRGTGDHYPEPAAGSEKPGRRRHVRPDGDHPLRRDAPVSDQDGKPGAAERVAAALPGVQPPREGPTRPAGPVHHRLGVRLSPRPPGESPAEGRCRPARQGGRFASTRASRAHQGTARAELSRGAPRAARRAGRRGWRASQVSGSWCRSGCPARPRRAARRTAGWTRRPPAPAPPGDCHAGSSKAASSFLGISTRSLAMKPWSWLTLVIGMIPGMIGTVTPAARAAATKSKYAWLSKKSWVIRYDAPRPPSPWSSAARRRARPTPGGSRGSRRHRRRGRTRR